MPTLKYAARIEEKETGKDDMQHTESTTQITAADKCEVRRGYEYKDVLTTLYMPGVIKLVYYDLALGLYNESRDPILIDSMWLVSSAAKNEQELR